MRGILTLLLVLLSPTLALSEGYQFTDSTRPVYTFSSAAPSALPSSQEGKSPSPDACVVDVQWEGRGGSGTCVWSEDGKSLVITNAHVAPTNGRTTVKHEGKTYRAEWVGAAEDADLAALLVDGTLPVAPVAREEPPVGSRVRKWGFPGYANGAKVFGSGPLLSRGTSIIVIGFPPYPGDSGSGLFDEKGRVIGVIRTTDYRTGGVVGLQPLRTFLERIRDRVSSRAAKRVSDYAEACRLVESGKRVLYEVRDRDPLFQGWEPGVYECWQDEDGTCRMQLRPEAPKPVVPRVPQSQPQSQSQPRPQPQRYFREYCPT